MPPAIRLNKIWLTMESVSFNLHLHPLCTWYSAEAPTFLLFIAALTFIINFARNISLEIDKCKN